MSNERILTLLAALLLIGACVGLGILVAFAYTGSPA